MLRFSGRHFGNGIAGDAEQASERPSAPRRTESRSDAAATDMADAADRPACRDVAGSTVDRATPEALESDNPAAAAPTADRLLDVDQCTFESIWDDVLGIARRLMAKERGDHTLQPTALVHEAYLKLLTAGGSPLRSPLQWKAEACGAMRRILVDHARRHAALRRGGGWSRVPDVERCGTGAPDAGGDPSLVGCRTKGLDRRRGGGGIERISILALHEALRHMERSDPLSARVVELRFFGELTNEEIASLLGVTSRTVQNRWSTARAWLRVRFEDSLSERAAAAPPEDGGSDLPSSAPRPRASLSST
ncbi:MAG TPA: ECF-type sigma factor [Phycisphaerales bacterium]|nr:ECF-type sigma factor [Phycisphaerales bacterium]HMP38484.1 ECF-type sigma factor [Phycisphaerales bacterium]